MQEWRDATNKLHRDRNLPVYLRPGKKSGTNTDNCTATATNLQGWDRTVPASGSHTDCPVENMADLHMYSQTAVTCGAWMERMERASTSAWSQPLTFDLRLCGLCCKRKCAKWKHRDNQSSKKHDARVAERGGATAPRKGFACTFISHRGSRVVPIRATAPRR